MAIECTTSNLATLASCFDCVPENVLQAMRIRLLCALINGETVECDVDTLVEDAKCYACLSAQQRAAIETYLVCQVAGGGAVGGLVGVVDPEGAVTASPGVSYANTALHTFWYKETGTGNTGWFQYA